MKLFFSHNALVDQVVTRFGMIFETDRPSNISPPYRIKKVSRDNHNYFAGYYFHVLYRHIYVPSKNQY
jgi:hypothetical protein